MTEIEPQFLEVVSTSAQELRSTFSIFQPGVFAAGDLKVTAGGAGLTVDVAAGVAIVRGSNITDQGQYRVRNDATKNSAAFDVAGIPANSSGFPRIDQVIARVLDQTHDSSGLRRWRLEYVAGTGTSGATLDNRTGAVSDVGLGNNWLRLADALIPSGAATVLAGNVRDRRLWCRGALNRLVLTTGGNKSTTSTTLVAVDATNLSPRIECSGVPMRVSFKGVHSSGGSGQNLYAVFVDGVQTDGIGTGGQLGGAPSPSLQSTPPTMNIIPTAGSHLIGPAWATTGAIIALTVSTAAPLTLLIEEIVRQNANNS